MSFDNIRNIVETRLFDGSVNRVFYPISSANSADGLIDTINGDKVVTATLNSSGNYVKGEEVIVFRDGESPESYVGSYVAMSFSDLVSKPLTKNGSVSVTSGFVSFSISIQNTSGNQRRLTNLVADVLEKRFGVKAGSDTLDKGRYPSGEVGGTLYTYKGSLKKIDDSDSGFFISIFTIQYDYYY